MELCFGVLAFGLGYQTGQIQIRCLVCAQLRKLAGDCQSRSHIKTDQSACKVPSLQLPELHQQVAPFRTPSARLSQHSPTRAQMPRKNFLSSSARLMWRGSRDADIGH